MLEKDEEDAEEEDTSHSSMQTGKDTRGGPKDYSNRLIDHTFTLCLTLLLLPDFRWESIVIITTKTIITIKRNHEIG